MPILNWLNKDQATSAAKQSAYRVLEEVSDLSYGDPNNENLLIQGDNLEALKALIPFYAGKVKCIFIDPPYNTKSAFEHYDDNLEHSQWLTMMYPRLELLRELLAEDGSIWITIDDNESHYLKIIMDEIFGRKNFVSSIIWEKDAGRKNDTTISSSHDYVLVYAKAFDEWKKVRNLLPRGEEQLKRYKNPDDDPRGPWRQGADGTAKSGSDKLRYEIELPSGRVVTPPSGNFWRFSRETYEKALSENRVYFGRDGNRLPVIKKYLSEIQGGMVPKTWWPSSDVGSNQEARRDHLRKLLPDIQPFDTPKPERLLERIIHISSNPGDIILDSFAGSGTTATTAHKMGRKWIAVELGDQAKTYIYPRFKKVIDGKDKLGISESVGWNGGGGFRFCQLGHAVFDEYGRLNSEIKFPTLASHVWYLETKQPLSVKKRIPFLGVHEDSAYYLLYNGVLGDRSLDGGNVLTRKTLSRLPMLEDHIAAKRRVVIYGEYSRLGESSLNHSNIAFKQIPYDVGAL